MQKNVACTLLAFRMSKMRVVPAIDTRMPSSKEMSTPCSRGTSNSSVSKLNKLMSWFVLRSVHREFFFVKCWFTKAHFWLAAEG